MAGGALDGQWYVSSADPAAAFQAAFRKRFPHDLLIGAANCHDAVLLLAQGLKYAGPSEKAPAALINAYLSKVKVLP